MESVNRKLVNMYELITCLSNAVDLVSPKLASHHHQVAYLAYKIGEELNFPENQRTNLMLAGLLHDIGAFSFSERIELIETELPNAQDHGFKGAKLLEGFKPLKDVASVIRYHHVPWDNGRGKYFMGEEVSLLSHILHLADRVAVLIDHDYEVLGQVKQIINNISEQKNTVFMPELVDALIKLSVQENIWLDMVNKSILNIISEIIIFETIELDIDGVIDLTKIFARIIDFRSSFTAYHTAGVAKTAEKLSELAGFSKNESKMMLVAGYLHDLGKLAVRNDVLEKPYKLTPEEFNIIRSHTYYTYHLLHPIKEFKTINIWASFHHEKLNGRGYPFHMEDRSIPLGSRIMAVADIFTAITEDRPYRKGMSDKETIDVLKSLIDDKSICPYVASILFDNFNYIYDIRKEAQQEAAIEYNYFVNFNKATKGI